MKFDVIIGNPPFTDRNNQDSSNGRQTKDLDDKFVMLALSLGEYVSIIFRNKYFSKPNSVFRRGLVSNKKLMLVKYVPPSLFNISPDTCRIIVGESSSEKFEVVFEDGKTKEYIHSEDVVINFFNPDYNPIVKNNLAHRFRRYRLNQNTLLDGEYPIVLSMGSIKNKEPILKFVIKEQYKYGVGEYGVLMNKVRGGRTLGKIAIKDPRHAMSDGCVLLKTESEEQSYQLYEYLKSKDIEGLVAINKRSNANTKELFASIPDPLL